MTTCFVSWRNHFTMEKPHREPTADSGYGSSHLPGAVHKQGICSRLALLSPLVLSETEASPPRTGVSEMQDLFSQGSAHVLGWD